MNYRPVINVTPTQKKTIKQKALENNITEKEFYTKLVLIGYQALCNN